MKRRNFLKLVAAAVVCPKGLLAKREPLVKGIEFTERTMLSGKKFATYYVDFQPFATEEEREKYRAKFRKALKNTKFHPPKFAGCLYYKGVPCYYKDQLNG